MKCLLLILQQESIPPPATRTGKDIKAYNFDAGSPVKAGNQDDPDWLAAPAGKKVCCTNVCYVVWWSACHDMMRLDRSLGTGKAPEGTQDAGRGGFYKASPDICQQDSK